jgi:hypothetical protein
MPKTVNQLSETEIDARLHDLALEAKELREVRKKALKESFPKRVKVNYYERNQGYGYGQGSNAPLSDGRLKSQFGIEKTDPAYSTFVALRNINLTIDIHKDGSISLIGVDGLKLHEAKPDGAKTKHEKPS